MLPTSTGFLENTQARLHFDSPQMNADERRLNYPKLVRNHLRSSAFICGE